MKLYLNEQAWCQCHAADSTHIKHNLLHPMRRHNPEHPTTAQTFEAKSQSLDIKWHNCSRFCWKMSSKVCRPQKVAVCQNLVVEQLNNDWLGWAMSSMYIYKNHCMYCMSMHHLCRRLHNQAMMNTTLVHMILVSRLHTSCSKPPQSSSSASTCSPDVAAVPCPLLKGCASCKLWVIEVKMNVYPYCILVCMLA